MTDLNALIVFAKMIGAGGFSEAARRLKMPVSMVSRRIADLEDRLGIRLLKRSRSSRSSFAPTFFSDLPI